MPRLRRARLAALALILFVGTKQGGADELPPGLEEAILNPRIPMIVDATITRFNKDGHAVIKVNSVYKPATAPGKKAVTPSTVRGYASSGKPTRIVPIKVLTDRGKTRFLFFLDGDLLFSTYNNRFEVRESEKKQLIVHTGREWKPLKDIVKLIPKTASRPAGSNDEGKLRRSLERWKKARKDCGGNYSYDVRRSGLRGLVHETRVTVRDNRVVERRYRSFRRPTRPGEAPGKPAGTAWVEKRADLGSHQQGAPARTLDELYAEAARVIRRELPKHERRHLGFDKQGLLLACFTVDTRIADDAPRKGVSLADISLAKRDDSGNAPAPRKVYKSPNGKAYPSHWGAPPRRQTRDLRPLPGGYGRGSGTLARWIGMNLDRDAKRKPPKKG